MYKDIYKFMLKYPFNVEHFSKEQIVFTDRSLLRKDFIVLSGEMIEVFSNEGDERESSTLLYRAGDVFGIMGQNPDLVFKTTGIAKSDLEILSFSEDKFFKLLKTDSELNSLVMKSMFQLFNRMENKFCALAVWTPSQRVVEFMCRIQTESLNNVVHMSTESIALALSTTRQTVSKTINDLKKRGLLKSEYKAIKLLDIPTIRNIYGISNVKELKA